MFDYDELAEAGIETVEIDYHGEGDEGYIEEIVTEPEGVTYGDALYRDIEQTAYDILSSRHPGWEITEGSHGKLTIFVKERRAELKHGSIEHVTNWTTEAVS